MHQSGLDSTPLSSKWYVACNSQSWYHPLFSGFHGRKGWWPVACVATWEGWCVELMEASNTNPDDKDSQPCLHQKWQKGMVDCICCELSSTIQFCWQRRHFLCPVWSSRNQDEGLSVYGFQISPILKSQCIQHAQYLICAILKCHTVVSIMPIAFLRFVFLKHPWGDALYSVITTNGNFYTEIQIKGSKWILQWMKAMQ